jgi:hypothetical protein
MGEKTRKLIIINVVIFILEALCIYFYLTYHSTASSPENLENLSENADKRRSVEMEDSSLISNPQVLLQQQFLCSTCSYNDIKEYSELESIFATNQQQKALLNREVVNVVLFYTKFDMPVTSMLPVYPIYTVQYIDPSLSDTKRLFIRPNSQWKVETNLFPYFERTKEQQIQHIIPIVDCSVLFKACWKFQLNHHTFPLFLVFNKTSLKEQYLMRNDAFLVEENYPSVTDPRLPLNNNDGITVPVDVNNPHLQAKIDPIKSQEVKSTQPLTRKENSENRVTQSTHSEELPHNKDELHQWWKEKMQSNSVVKKQVDVTQKENSLNTPLQLYKQDFKKERSLPTGNFLFSDSPSISEITPQEVYSFFNDTSPLYPKILLFYSDFDCQACLHIRAPYQLVSSRAFKIISGYNSFHAERSIELIPFIRFYAVNLHYFTDQHLYSLFRIDFHTKERDLPKLYGIHFHILQSQLLNNLKVWNMEKFEKMNFNTIEHESVHHEIDGKLVFFSCLLLCLFLFFSFCLGLPSQYDVEEINLHQLMKYIDLNYLVFIRTQ